MKRKRVVFLLLSAALLLFRTTWAEQTDKEEKKYYFYYVDSTKTLLERETFRPLEETAEEMLAEITAHLNNEEGTTTRKLLPDDVTILHYTLLDDGTLVLDFSETYQDISPESEILIRDGIVKTYLQIPGANAVEFQIDGMELVNPKGETVGPLNEDSFVDLALKGTDAYRYESFTLYFADKDGKKLIPEKRRVYYKSSINKARVALEQLINGPLDKGRYPTVPGNAELNRVTLSDDVCYVDFNSAFVRYALTDLEERTAVYSVVNTVLAATGAEKVEISINGDKKVTFGENTDLYRFFHWNQEIIKEEEA